MFNLANNIDYKIILDSLKLHLDYRIKDSKKKPPGLGPQFQERRLRKEVNYTPGDIHSINGKRIYIKPSDE